MELETFTDPEQALLRCGERDFDVVMSDHHMPAFSGVDFLSMLRRIQPLAVRVVLSASTEAAVVLKAVNQAEVFRYLAKPWSDADIQQVLELAFERAAQLRAQAGATDRSLSPQEQESRRLEREEPGITKVNWRPDGGIDL